MRGLGRRRGWLAALCAMALGLGAAAAPAQGAPEDPLFVYVPLPPPPLSGLPMVPPVGYFYGPCGMGVDSAGNFYVSDYYHHAVDVFRADDANYTNPSIRATGYITQIRNVDPDDGPCGLAFDAANNLYVNNYHRNVMRFNPSPSFGAGTVIAGAGVDSTHPTGVAVDPVTGNVYVDNRTYISVYDLAGAPVLDGGNPLRIGVGSLTDGYGIAYSSFPGSLAFPTPTAGYLYVPDAATNTVKVYDPATDKANPVDQIDASDTPEGRFVSLRDAAVAVDRVTGEIYVVDNLQPQYTERPQAIVYVFTPAGTYKGQLKYKVTDALPPGLAVDNTAGATQGRVYVTSGNTVHAGVFAYPPGAATRNPPLDPTVSAAPAGPPAPDQTQSGGGAGASSTSSSAPLASASEITQRGNLRVTVNGKLSPKRLPRDRAAPIGVSVDWDLATTDSTDVPKLQRLRIEINRYGRFDSTGLAVCDIDKIQPATTGRALSGCRPSLVGRGSVSAKVGLEGQESYETTGRLVVFNARRAGRPVLYGHIYSPKPFAISFVIVFRVQRASKGTYGTVLNATLPKALGDWGNLTGLDMTLSRRYHYKGERRSFVSAGCPAPRGFPGAVFSLARASFGFEGGQSLRSVLSGSCKVRG